MISPEERRYLYWLGRVVWSGKGAVVEIGPWLGGSTVCLAAGMRDSDTDARGRLHTVDNFLWREFMAERAPLPIEVGGSFKPAFLENTRDFSDIVVTYERALPDERIEDDEPAARTRYSDEEIVPTFEGIPGPVEILFIDGAKSWRGMLHLLRVLRGGLFPGSYLVCQDYKYWGTYWVPIMMGVLTECVEPVHDVLGGNTVAFRLRKAIPPALLASLPDHVADLSTGVGLSAIDEARELLDGDGDPLGASTVHLGKVSFLAHQGTLSAASRVFDEVQRNWPLLGNPTQLERARRYLRDEKGCDPERPLGVTLRILASRLWKTLLGIGRLLSPRHR